MIVLGPAPSLRLGCSLGIHPVPPRACTYSCVYCRAGLTGQLVDERAPFQNLDRVVAAVEDAVEAAKAAEVWIDHLALLPDGEPTLDINLGELIRALHRLGIPIAVVSNGALLDREDVRADLAAADYVSLKVDAVEDGPWRRVNRPHGRFELREVLEGIREFAAGFRGRLVTETTLVAGLNDEETGLRATASFIGDLHPAIAYLAVPPRPPAEPWVRPPSAQDLTAAYEVFRGLAGRVELLVDEDGSAFTPTGDPRQDLLGVAALHPMREQAVTRLLTRAGASSALLERLVGEGELVSAEYGGYRYYLRPPWADPERKEA